MKAKPPSPAQRRASALHGPKHYRIVVPPPGSREVDTGLEFRFLDAAPWLVEKFELDPADAELLERRGLYQGLNLDVFRGYAGRYNECLAVWAGAESFFQSQEPVLAQLERCHREAVERWQAHAALHRNRFRDLHARSQSNRKVIH
ncbi:MAG: hypothetical protein KGS61_19300, partial [Verrucomicrobia bacterium]|nr:hypothetical protein [Verrucomicrobiota bacterium]